MTSDIAAKSSPPSQSAVSVAGWVMAIAAAGILVTSAGYALSPPEAAMPSGPVDVRAAMAGAVRGHATMHLAGLAGMPADSLLAGAWIALGIGELNARRGLSAIGWFVLTCSTLLFTTTDMMVGFVLPGLAASGDEQAFLAAKTVFDAYFLVSTFTFGLGALITLFRHAGTSDGIGRPLALLGLATGAICAVAGAAGLLEIGVWTRALGAGVTAGVFAFLLIGVRVGLRGHL